MKVGVTIVGLDTLMLRLSKLGNISPARLSQIGNIAVSGVKTNFEGNPLGWRDIAESTKTAKGSSQILVDKTDLKNSIFFRPAENGIEVVTQDPKALWMEKGTPPHDIYPRSKTNSRGKPSALRFLTKDGFRFAKMVKHPGTVPRPFMVLRPEVRAQIMRVLREALVEGT